MEWMLPGYCEWSDRVRELLLKGFGWCAGDGEEDIEGEVGLAFDVCAESRLDVEGQLKSIGAW